MPLVDHFIYTTGSIGNKTGYQVVAQTEGIDKNILNELEGYFFPVGMDPNDFVESCSLLILSNGHIAYSRIKNIGVGSDGRENTLYNHTIVMNTSLFQKLDNDSRLLSNYYVQKPNFQGTLDS